MAPTKDLISLWGGGFEPFKSCSLFSFSSFTSKKDIGGLDLHVCVESFIHLRCVQSRKSSSFAPDELIR